MGNLQLDFVHHILFQINLFANGEENLVVAFLVSSMITLKPVRNVLKPHKI